VKLDGKFVSDATTEITVHDPERWRTQTHHDDDRAGPLRRRVPADKPGSYQVQLIQQTKAGAEVLRRAAWW